MGGVNTCTTLTPFNRLGIRYAYSSVSHCAKSYTHYRQFCSIQVERFLYLFRELRKCLVLGLSTCLNWYGDLRIFHFVSLDEWPSRHALKCLRSIRSVNIVLREQRPCLPR